MDFGQQIDKERGKKKLSRAKLAAKADISPPTMRKVLSGDRSIGIDTLDKAAGALNMTVIIKLIPKPEEAPANS